MRVILSYRQAHFYEWSTLYDCNDAEDYGRHSFEEACRNGFNNYSAWQRNDYVVRCWCPDTGVIIGQWPAGRGALSTDPEYPEIPWDFSRVAPPKGTGEIRNMIKVGVRKVGGKLKLLVDAKDFHAQLDEIGCTHSNGKYNDRPAAANQVASGTFVMSTEVLLTRDYREVEVTELKKVGDKMEKVTVKVPVTACVDLSSVWSAPPSFEQLKKLCNSAHDTARKVLEHYQPIDISVEIHKRVVKT